MNWITIEKSPENLQLDDTVRLKNNLLAKVNGFTRNTKPRIFVLEIIEGFHKGEIIKAELSEIAELGRLE